MRSAAVYMLGIIVLLTIAPACSTNVPPNLSPTGVAAFQTTRFVKAADILRDFAIDGNAQTPPLFDTATTRQIVVWHEAALKAAQGALTGWKTGVIAGLAAIVNALPAALSAKLSPYAALVNATLQDL